MNTIAFENIIAQVMKDILSQKRFPFGIRQKGKSNKRATGNLINSIKVKNVILSEDIEELTFDVDALYYFLYVDKGRNIGKMPNIGKIRQWIIDKKVRIKDKKGKFITKSEKNLDRAAFGISKGLEKNPIRPTNIIKIAKTEIKNNPTFIKLYMEAGFEKLDDKIKLD